MVLAKASPFMLYWVGSLKSEVACVRAREASRAEIRVGWACDQGSFYDFAVISLL